MCDPEHCPRLPPSAVEEADTVFSIEQTRGELTEDKVSVIEVEDTEDEMSSSSSSSSDLYHRLKNDPEDLLQLAPAPGDTIIPLTGEAQTHFSCSRILLKDT